MRRRDCSFRWRRLAFLLISCFILGCPVNERTERMPSETMINDDTNTELECEEGYTEMGGECVTNVGRDRDYDGVPDAVDNCPDAVNPDQQDCDVDGVGDVCDEDFPCGSVLVGEVTTVVDVQQGVINFSGGLIRLLPSGQVTEISQFGFYSTPISIGAHTVQVFDPADVLRARLNLTDGEPEDESLTEAEGEGQGSSLDSDDETGTDAQDGDESMNADGQATDETTELSVPSGIDPVLERDVEIQLRDMNETVRLNLLVGGYGRWAGAVCREGVERSEFFESPVSIRVEPFAGGDVQTFYTDSRGFFETENLLFGDYYVDFSLDGYVPVYLMKRMDQLGFVVFNEDEPCHVVMSPAETQ